MPAFEYRDYLSVTVVVIISCFNRFYFLCYANGLCLLLRRALLLYLYVYNYRVRGLKLILNTDGLFATVSDSVQCKKLLC
jgi:hypothetical protein